MNASTESTVREDLCATTPASDQESTSLTTAQPRWNAERTDDGIEVTVELPGVTKEKLTLEVEVRDLRLSARRAEPASSRRPIIGHRAPDTYALKLRLGESLDGEQLAAELKHGILRLKVPLAEEAKPRTISIL